MCDVESIYLLLNRIIIINKKYSINLLHSIMGNKELKAAFQNQNGNRDGKQLSLDILSEEKLVNELYQYVA
jgi:hypothetical protein